MRKNSKVAGVGMALMVCIFVAACDNSGTTPQPAAVSQNTPLSAAIQSTPTPAAQSGSSVQDRASLIAALEKAGATVSQDGPLEQPFLSVPGQTLSVNGKTVQTFEYTDNQAMAADASKIAPDGTIKAVSIMWTAQPHFYKSGRLLVIYPGTDASILNALSAVLGGPFAIGANVVGTPLTQP